MKDLLPILEKSAQSGRNMLIIAEDIEVYEDLVKAGVIDPTKVTRIALENAASVAGLLLMTEACIVENLRKKRCRASGRWYGRYGRNILINFKCQITNDK